MLPPIVRLGAEHMHEEALALAEARDGGRGAAAAASGREARQAAGEVDVEAVVRPAGTSGVNDLCAWAGIPYRGLAPGCVEDAEPEPEDAAAGRGAAGNAGGPGARQRGASTSARVPGDLHQRRRKTSYNLVLSSHILAGGRARHRGSRRSTARRAGGWASDIGGSIRVPVAWCVVVGFKSAYGTNPAAGMLPRATLMDHVGLDGLSTSTTSLVPTPSWGRLVRAVMAVSSMLGCSYIGRSRNAEPQGWRGGRVGSARARSER